jgi:hypothetical protein
VAGRRTPSSQEKWASSESNKWPQGSDELTAASGRPAVGVASSRSIRVRRRERARPRLRTCLDPKFFWILIL